jgi:hypothetical protein
MTMKHPYGTIGGGCQYMVQGSTVQRSGFFKKWPAIVIERNRSIAQKRLCIESTAVVITQARFEDTHAHWF